MNNTNIFSNFDDFKYINCMFNDSNCENFQPQTIYSEARLEQAKHIMDKYKLACEDKDEKCTNNIKNQIDMYTIKNADENIHIITTEKQMEDFEINEKNEMFDFLKDMYIHKDKIILYVMDTTKLIDSEKFLLSLLENNTYFYNISETGATYIIGKKLVTKIITDCVVCFGETCEKFVKFISVLLHTYSIEIINMKINGMIISSINAEMFKKIEHDILNALKATSDSIYQCISLEFSMSEKKDKI